MSSVIQAHKQMDLTVASLGSLGLWSGEGCKRRLGSYLQGAGLSECLLPGRFCLVCSGCLEKPQEICIGCCQHSWLCQDPGPVDVTDAGRTGFPQ